ncbi:MAG: hypothetical protein AB9903_13795 [Vulcanimicrobiota bacterium]
MKLKGCLKVITVIMILALVCGVVYRRHREGKLKIPLVKPSVYPSYIVPVFSENDSAAAFLKVTTVKKDSENEYKVEICHGDINGAQWKRRLQFTFTPFENLRIREYNSGTQTLRLEKEDLRALTRSEYSCNLASSQFTETMHNQPLISFEKSSSSPDGRYKVTITDADEKKNKMAQVDLIESGTKDRTVALARAADESFFTPRWRNSDLFIFQYQVPQNDVFFTQLLAYSLKTDAMTKLAADCVSPLLSPQGRAVAYLIPMDRGRVCDEPDEERPRWRLVVKNLDNTGELVPEEKVFSEDVDLYSWSGAGNGVLFQKGSKLSYIDCEKGEERDLLEAREDGWWGYPLSPYYISWAPDGSRLAVVLYLVADDRKSMIEKVVLFDMKNNTKDQIYSQILSAGNYGFHSSFHPHIVWSHNGSHLLFESRNISYPASTDIVLLSPASKESKILSRILWGIGNL